ncbi:MAG: hypothetical protein KDJ43_02030, partial [Rhizobiaceae bacterium]|nr:hypothetical protein [Rhizobiaceae bacterium]
AANADAQPVSAGGLAVADTRGASALAKADATPSDNLGIVIGFAAAPGQVALDGTSGENSPYAAALTRHISAMAGEEFGTVMRMVAEEVYLKTGGRQRPWVNESLRRLLYFGEAPQPVEGAEGDILTERRQLLLTISTLPTFGRSQVERVARNGGVPMDAVFAMLKALGSDTPDDPIELERILKSQTEELKRFLADRRVIENPDPELARLSALSDQAVAEGALDTARRLRAEVDRRIQELSAVIENEEELIRARRTEFAAEYAKSAEVAALSFDYAAAAAEYEKAHEQIARWDDRLAWDYRRRQIEQLLDDNRYRGDVKGFTRAGELALELLQDGRNLGNAELAESHLVYASFLSSDARMRRDPESREKAVENIDAALALLPPGEKRSDALGYKATILKLVGSELGVQPRLDEAAATYEEVFRDITPDGNPDLWQDMLSEYGNVLGLIAMRDQSAPKLRLSIEKLEEASRLAGEDDPLGRIIIDLQLATFRIAIPEIENSAGNDVELVNSVLVEMEASRDRIDAEQFPLARGLIEHAIAMTLIWRASSTGEDAVVDQAIDAFKRALEFRTRDRAPGEWAETSEQLGYAYNRKASITKDPAFYEQAAAYLENALAVYSPQNVPANWASVEFSRLVALRSIATAARDAEKLAEIAARVRAGLAEPALSALPDQMMNFGQELGLALWERYRIEGGLELLHQEVTELEAVLAAVEGSASPLEVGMTLLLVGDAANEIGKKETGTGFLHTAADAYGRSLALRTDQNPVDAGRIYFVRASVLKEIAEREGDKSYLHEAIANLETSLQLFDRDEYPVDYANALLDRATFEHALAERADEPLVRKLIAAYGEALEIYESAGDNLRTAIAARNLGFAYQTLDWVTSKEEHHQDAMKAYRKAIESGSGLGIEVDMFISHYELAQSLVGINRAAPSPELLQEALVSYRAAAATPQNLVGPRRWGDAQQKTAELLLHFGRNERNAELLGEAAAFFRAALTVRAPERSLLDWYYSKDGLKEA